MVGNVMVPKKWLKSEAVSLLGKVCNLQHLNDLPQTTYSESKLFDACSKFRKYTKETTNSGLSESTACRMLPKKWALNTGT